MIGWLFKLFVCCTSLLVGISEISSYSTARLGIGLLFVYEVVEMSNELSSRWRMEEWVEEGGCLVICCWWCGGRLGLSQSTSNV